MSQTDQIPGQKRNVAFKISSRTARMIGRQNVSNQFIALIELIKNAYDADSPSVTLEFKLKGKKFDSIVLIDQGSGMDAEAIENRWLVLGTDNKEREPVSPKGRVRAGAKGIGRFALDRLGNLGTVETYRDENADGLRLIIDWSKYDNPNTDFASIRHTLEDIANTEHKQGTKITISNLRDNWSEDDFRKLHEELGFLIPPLETFETAFSIELLIEGRDDLSGAIEPLVREAAEFELHSSIDADGTVTHRVRHRSGEEVSHDFSWGQVFPDSGTPLFGHLTPDCGPLTASMLFYVRDASTIESMGFGIVKLRRYLKTFGGVRLYRDGFQIQPYGSRDDDWLSLNDRKTRSPEGVGQELGSYKIANGQLVGTVILSRITNPNLEDKTNREGLIANAAFVDLKAFLIHGISFLELERQRRYQREKDGAPPVDPISRSVGALKSVVSEIKYSGRNRGSGAASVAKGGATLPPQVIDPTPEKSIEVTEEQLEELTAQVEAVEASALATVEEIQFLRALASLGLAMTTFAHEIEASILGVKNPARQLELMGVLPSEAQPFLQRIQDNAEKIDGWSDFILERVKKSRRQQQEVSFEEIARNISTALKKTFDRRKIDLLLEFGPDLPTFLAFPIDLEAILLNLMTNSIKALERASTSDRKIRVTATYENKILQVCFDDSGPGVNLADLPSPQDGVEQIFRPLVTRSGGDGIGMGLAVVSKIVEDQRGTITVLSKGPLGGASFTLKIPINLIGKSK